jgi:hypothetical protein
MITINDVRKAGHCVSGARRWFELHGFDFRAFVRDGLSEETLLATGDAMAIRVIRMKKEREAARG